MQPASHPPRAESKLAEFFDGVVDQLPILLGVVPFGLIFGALAIRAGIPPLLAQGFSVFIFAGSAQFISVGLVADGTPPLVIVFTVLIINLRHVLYSANLAQYLGHLPGRWKAALCWLLTDEAFALTSVRFQKKTSPNMHWYMLGTGLALWTSWQASTAVGITLGAQIPESWALEFALPLTFMALIAPTLVDRPAWAAALGAGLLSMALTGLPFKLNLVIGVIGGVVLGLALETRNPSRQRSGEQAP